MMMFLWSISFVLILNLKQEVDLWLLLYAFRHLSNPHKCKKGTAKFIKSLAQIVCKQFILMGFQLLAKAEVVSYLVTSYP